METVQEQNDEAYEMETIDHYFQHPQFVEQRIIRYVLAMTNIELDMGYISLYARQMNASAIKAENDKVIFVDELPMYTALSYFLTVFSHAYDHREQNTKRRVNSLLDLLQIQGKERTIGVHNLQDVLGMITLLRNVLDLAMDRFWSAWTFMVGHEIII